MTHIKSVFYWPLMALLLLLCAVSLIPAAAHAEDPKPTIRDDAYAVRYVSQSLPDPVEIEAGKTKTVVFRFKNTGAATLKRAGSRYVAAYTMNPRYHASELYGKGWAAVDQTAPLTADCAPGAICELALQLHAPKEAGLYRQDFHLAARAYSWVKGGYFWIEVNVVEPETKELIVDATSSEEAQQKEETAGPVGKIIGISKRSVKVQGGEEIPVTMILQNRGEEPWSGYSVHANTPTALAATGKRLTFADNSWQSDTFITSAKTEVAPNAFARVKFSLRAPAKQGTYTMSVETAVDGAVVAGSEREIEVTVTSDAPSHYKPPVFKDTGAEQVRDRDEPRLLEEPSIRVGVWKVDRNYVLFKPLTDNYIVYAGDTKKGSLKKGKAATLKIRGDEYSIKSGDQIDLRTKDYIRLVPENDPHAVFRIVNDDRAYQGTNFNEYRGAAEYRQVQNDDQMYVINDVLMSDYVAGMGENSNTAPAEYLKAQATAQRTYGYYIKEFSDKHDKRNFDVVAHTGDQLYLGYLSEAMRPRFVEAAKETDGYMVTYDLDENPKTESNIVITPYFAHTDGRTRSWKEVWGGHKPWLVSVQTTYDRKYGRRMFGHGVGMSQLDAANRAEFLDEDWKQLLAYYYRGTTVERVY